MKKLCVALMLILSTQVNAEHETSLKLSVDECMLAGRIIEQMAHNKDTGTPNGKLLSSVISDYKTFQEQHESIQELFKFSALVVASTNVPAKPEQHREGFNGFCFSHGGNVNKMIQVIKNYLRIREESV